jgi:hypothetical protein
MHKLTPFVFLFLLSTISAFAERTNPPSQTELARITERGRQLAAYDVAAWHATDAVMALKPAKASVDRYIAKKNGNGWTVAFGHLNKKRDKFIIAYEGIQGTNANEFIARKYEPPKEDAGFFLTAAKSIGTVMSDFKVPSRPYNIAVLPASSNQVYVYAVPAQTQKDIYPLGGDVRYLVSPDGSEIIEKRQLHSSIIELKAPSNLEQPEAGYHTAVLDDIPEDTDVFHVLSRKPSMPEYVGTKKHVYRIEEDGTIKYLMTAEEFEKTRNE